MNNDWRSRMLVGKSCPANGLLDTCVKKLNFWAAFFLCVSASCPYTFLTEIPLSECLNHAAMVTKSSPAITHWLEKRRR